MKIYIAHPTPLRHRIRDTVCPVIQSLSIQTINPFYKSDGTYREDRPEVKAMDEGRMNDYDVKKTLGAEDIVLRDLEKIRDADALVAILDDEATKNSACIGTSMEIFYCSRWCKKPVFIIATGKYYYHPWLNYLAKLSGGAIVGSYDELYSRLQRWKRSEDLL